MKSTDLYAAFEAVDEAVLERSENASVHNVISLRRRIVMAAAAVLVVIVLTGAAVLNYSDSIQNWLEWTWKQYTDTEISTQQDMLIEHLSQKIGLSETIEGVTVTVDSAMVGDNTAYILVRIEGAKDYDLYGGSGIVCEGEYLDIGHALSTHPGADDSIVVYIHKTFNTYGEPVDINEPFEVNLKMDGANVGVNGSWDFTFDLKPNTVNSMMLPDTMVEITTEFLLNQELYANVQINETVLFKNLKLSETGLSGEYYSELEISTDRTIYAIMENGEKAVLCRGLIWSDLAEEELYYTFSLNFEVPVNLDEVTAVQIFDTVIPVK